jgi:hypothetical protein
MPVVREACGIIDGLSASGKPNKCFTRVNPFIIANLLPPGVYKISVFPDNNGLVAHV